MLVEGQGELADEGRTADALRALADDLVNQEAQAGGRGVLRLRLGRVRRFVLQPRPNGATSTTAANHSLRQSQHWPAALQFDFDVGDVRDELGLEVLRGFVCPLTLDLVRQPAMLLSSNVTMPSSYDKEAICTWLADNIGCGTHTWAAGLVNLERCSLLVM